MLRDACVVHHRGRPAAGCCCWLLLHVCCQTSKLTKMAKARENGSTVYIVISDIALIS
jgi:hypothetical protein